MDLKTAYEILGLSPTAPLEEIKKRYRQLAKQVHPDISSTHDSRQFILLTTAYYLILDERGGKKKKAPKEENGVADEEIASAFVIQEHIQERFDRLKREFQEFFDQKALRTRDRIADLINSASSGSGLKGIVQDSVARVWIEMVKEIENYLLKLCKLATTEDADFLYALFSDLYAEQRRFWLANLYRNPATLFCVASFLLLCAAPAYPQLAPIAATFRLETTPWITFFPLVAGLGFVVVRLRQLNPRYQFLPPRLSAFEVQSQMYGIAKGVGQDLGEATTGGAAAGAIVGTFLVPGVGTLIGAGIGALLGLFSGEALADMKERVWLRIDTEMGLGLEQLNDRLQAWLEQQREQYTKAATQSFARNIKKVAQFLTSHIKVAKQLAVESRLLLLAPENQAQQSSETAGSELSVSPIQSKEGQPSSGRRDHSFSFAGNLVVVLFVVVGGWVAANRKPQTELLPEPLSVPSEMPSSVTKESYVIVLAEKAHIRSGPGTGFSVVAQVRRGETFAVESQEGNWYKISHNGQDTWIHKSTVKEQSPGSSSPSFQ